MHTVGLKQSRTSPITLPTSRGPTVLVMTANGGDEKETDEKQACALLIR